VHTKDKMWRLCQDISDTRQHHAAYLLLSQRQRITWKYVVLFIALLLSLTGCGWFEKQEFPKELLGQWYPENSKYEGCYMIIDKESITFNAADNNLYVNLIEKVETTIEFGRKVYHIFYSDKEGIDHLLSVILLKGSKKGQLQFYNQRYLEWERLREAP